MRAETSKQGKALGPPRPAAVGSEGEPRALPTRLFQVAYLKQAGVEVFPVSLRVKRPGCGNPNQQSPEKTRIFSFSEHSRRRLRFRAINAFPAFVSHFGLTYHNQWPTMAEPQRHISRHETITHPGTPSSTTVAFRPPPRSRPKPSTGWTMAPSPTSMPPPPAAPARKSPLNRRPPVFTPPPPAPPRAKLADPSSSRPCFNEMRYPPPNRT